MIVSFTKTIAGIIVLLGLIWSIQDSIRHPKYACPKCFIGELVLRDTPPQMQRDGTIVEGNFRIECARCREFWAPGVILGIDTRYLRNYKAVQQ